ncbi:MAG TPA: glycosyltransferase family 2 protein [Kiritimatiellia bacterium]|nr:glycosyltransferase family 2 protein [Kiritimatiellia bacterium]
MPASAPSACVIIPAFNEAAAIDGVVREALTVTPDVLVVDDGSIDETGRLAAEAGAQVQRLEANLGKGAALLHGFVWARERGCEVVVTLDADGQHDAREIARFIDTYRRTRIPVLIGNRLWDPARMPPIRRWTNQFMSRLLSRMMGRYLPDTQCGFRLYRTDILAYAPVQSRRFAMESEILLQLALRGFRMDSVRIPTWYRGETSSIHPILDTVRFILMLLRFQHERRMRRA